MTDERSLHLQVLIEEYRTISAEIQLYLREMFKCLTYAAILIAIYLGWGLKVQGDLNPISKYVPYAIIVLALYFLSVSYIRINLSRRRAQLEKNINQRAGAELMGFDSKYTRLVQSTGFLKFGTAWYMRLPTPILLFGSLTGILVLLVFSLGGIRESRWVSLTFMVACGLAAIYVFLIYPKVVDKAIRLAEKNRAKL